MEKRKWKQVAYSRERFAKKKLNSCVSFHLESVISRRMR
jgi:hypothetical protein